jgi:very-short-patch-repair endonuclease
MQERGETEYRHEQFVLQNYFKIYAPRIITEQEYKVFHEGILFAKIDLADLTNKIAWRLNGEIHTGKRAMEDEEQKELLERHGWIVLDIPKDSYNWYWLWEK